LPVQKIKFEHMLSETDSSYEEMGVIPLPNFEEPDFSVTVEHYIDLEDHPPNLTECMETVSTKVSNYDLYDRPQEILRWSLPYGTQLKPIVGFMKGGIDNVIAYNHKSADIYIVGLKHPYQNLPALGNFLQVWELRVPLSFLKADDPYYIKKARFTGPSFDSRYLAELDGYVDKRQTPGKAYYLLYDKLIQAGFQVHSFNYDPLVPSNLCFDVPELEILYDYHERFLIAANWLDSFVVKRMNETIILGAKKAGISRNVRFSGADAFDRALAAAVFLGFYPRTEGKVRSSFLVFCFMSEIIQVDRGGRAITFIIEDDIN
jgi:hypothetical protein